jgi:putative transposase
MGRKAADHRPHKRLNNWIENAYQPTRRKEKCLIKFKFAPGVQRLLSRIGKVRNIFSMEGGRYKNKAPPDQRLAFAVAKVMAEGSYTASFCPNLTVLNRNLPSISKLTVPY